MRINWSRRAKSDLYDLKGYIAAESPYYAKQFTERIIEAINKLQEQPKIGQQVPEAKQGNVREVISQGYRIMYLIKPDHIYVVAIIHSPSDHHSLADKPWNMI